MTDTLNNDLLDGICKVAVEPERFRELTHIWGGYLSELDGNEYPELTTDFTQLEEHLNQASSILDMVETSSDAKAVSLTQILAQDVQPMFAVCQDRVIKAVNRAARTHLGLKPDVTLSESGLTTEALGIINQELTSRFSQDDTQTLDLIHIRFAHSDTPLIVSLTNWQSASGRDFVLFKTTNVVWPDYLTPVITQAFGLTSAEADIVRLLVEGANIDSVAAKRGSRISTVRSQIRSRYKKTETKTKPN